MFVLLYSSSPKWRFVLWLLPSEVGIISLLLLYSIHSDRDLSIIITNIHSAVDQLIDIKQP